MKHSIVWLTAGMLLLSLVTVFDYQNHPDHWRFRVLAASSIILFLFFLLGLISAVRKKRKN